MSFENNNLNTGDCNPLWTSPVTRKRRSSNALNGASYSAKRRRISLASVDLSREILPQTIRETRTGSSADRFIPSRPSYNIPFNSTPRTNRIAKKWGVADSRLLNFADSPPPSDISAPRQFDKSDANIHHLLRTSASQLFSNPPAPRVTSSTLNLARRPVPVLALDGPGISNDVYAYPVSWSSTNNIAVACGSEVFFQNLNTRKIAKLCSLPTTGDKVHCIQWAPKSTVSAEKLALGSTFGRVYLCDIESSRTLARTWENDIDDYGLLGAIDWCNDGSETFAIGRGLGSISLYDSRMPEVIKSVPGHKAKVIGLKWSPDSNLLASGDRDGIVHIWDIRSEKNLVQKQKMKHKGPVKALAWCPCEPALFATGGMYPDGIIRVWNTSTISSASSAQEPVQTVAMNTSITSLLWSPHCRELLSTYGSTWSLSTETVHPSGPLSSHFVPNNQAPIANSVTVHAYPSMNRLVSVQAHGGFINHSCLSPDGTKAFTASAWDESMKMWNIWGVRETVRKKGSVFDKHTIR